MKQLIKISGYLSKIFVLAIFISGFLFTYYSPENTDSPSSLITGLLYATGAISIIIFLVSCREVYYDFILKSSFNTSEDPSPETISDNEIKFLKKYCSRFGLISANFSRHSISFRKRSYKYVFWFFGIVLGLIFIAQLILRLVDNPELKEYEFVLFFGLIIPGAFSAYFIYKAKKCGPTQVYISKTECIFPGSHVKIKTQDVNSLCFASYKSVEVSRITYNEDESYSKSPTYIDVYHYNLTAVDEESENEIFLFDRKHKRNVLAEEFAYYLGKLAREITNVKLLISDNDDAENKHSSTIGAK